ncbi:MAG: hypothetical protein ABR75_02815, partial [Acidimicrobiia bacterium BACL6 MAG-120924-bin43]
MSAILAKAPTTLDLWMLLVIVVLLFVLIFLSLAEMSMSQMTKPRAAALAEKGAKSGKALVRLAAEPAMWVNPLLLLINVFQTVQATLTGIVANNLFGPGGVAVGVALNVVLFFVLAEAVPKTYALINPIKGATITARPIAFVVRFWPLRMTSGLLIRLTNVIVKGKGLAQGPFIGEQEFLGIVEAAAQDSVIEHEERELIESVIEFGDTMVREVMRPRHDVVFLDDDMTVTAALDKAVAEGFSRLPVFRKDDDEVDDVVGIVYVKDLVIAERSGKGMDILRDLVREVEVVPETKLVAELMRGMQAKKFHMVIVADEYGSVTGLATLEDCLEELVGEIVDEHDDEDDSLRVLPNGDLLVDGSMPIGRLNNEIST